MENNAIEQLLIGSKEILSKLKGKKSRRDFLSKVMSLNENGDMILENLFSGLTTVLEGLDDVGKVRFMSPLVDLVDEYRQRQSSGFDYEQAERVREAKGLARETLAPIIGIHAITIYKMEKGDLPFDSKKPKHQVYLKWLVENGYVETSDAT